ncbi:hypothetical protein [Hyphomicrobium sp. CS1BSMeth3]|uniref:hypothetical protein n=1 Tax=Hyphomicrobium sp. CS1BSMeth3 TaxID=1892844 RepID=UPI0011603DF0|nr:hypothetical protein [Hyphomicrobium sp. CS1BSMeth3]
MIPEHTDAVAEGGAVELEVARVGGFFQAPGAVLPEDGARWRIGEERAAEARGGLLAGLLVRAQDGGDVGPRGDEVGALAERIGEDVGGEFGDGFGRLGAGAREVAQQLGGEGGELRVIEVEAARLNDDGEQLGGDGARQAVGGEGDFEGKVGAGGGLAGKYAFDGLLGDVADGAGISRQVSMLSSLPRVWGGVGLLQGGGVILASAEGV